jgi:hypothetical protein
MPKNLTMAVIRSEHQDNHDMMQSFRNFPEIKKTKSFGTTRKVFLKINVIGKNIVPRPKKKRLLF